MTLFLLTLFACEPAPAPTPPPVVEPAPTPAAPQQRAATLRAAPEHVAAELFARPMASVSPGAAPEGFSVYVLALSWAPSFCCSSAGMKNGKEECDSLAGSPPPFGANHLSLHGLWPQYSDAESTQHNGQQYPAYCGDPQCNTRTPPDSCDPDPSTFPANLGTYGPGYTANDNYLADHEWPKHGSCTGLDSGTYFQAAIDSLLSLGGDQGTPALLSSSIGTTVKRDDLAAAIGSAGAVLLSCDSSCQLQQVEVCFSVGSDKKPAGQIPCPQSAVASSYDNSCAPYAGDSSNKARQGCDTITVQPFGQCGSSGGSGGTGGTGGTCSHPGQGPACTDDATCETDGYLRCASSGCCTTIPK